MKRLLFFLALSTPLFGQYTNPIGPPSGQINWPRVTGSGTPTSAGFTCAAANVGQPYTDKTGQHYWVCTSGGWFQVDGAGSSLTIEHNGTSVPTQNPLNFLDNTPNLDPGYIPVTFKNDGSGGMGGEVPQSTLKMQVVPPDSNLGVFVPFTVCTPATSNSSLTTNTTGVGQQLCDPTSGNQASFAGGLFNHNVNMNIVYSVPDTSKIPAGATITNIWGISYNSGWGAYNVGCRGSINNLTGSNGNQTQVDLATTDLAGTTCTANLSYSVFAFQSPFTIIAGQNVTLIGLWVEYTGGPPVPNSGINVQYPLTVTPYSNTLGIATKNWPNSIIPLPLLSIGNAASYLPGTAFLITDATATSGVCTGGGTIETWATSDGSNWQCSPFSGAGNVSSVTDPTSTLNISPTTGAVLAALNTAHTNTWTAIQYFNSSIELNGGHSGLRLNGSGGASGLCVVGQGDGNTPAWLPCGSGSGSVSGQASGVIGIATDATTTGAQSHIDENTAGTTTVNQKFAVNDSSNPSQITFTYNSHAFSPGSATTSGVGVDASGNLIGSDAGGAASRVCTATNGVCAGSGSLNVNGTPVSSPNLQDSATVTFGVSGSNITATAAGGSGGTPAGVNGNPQINASGSFGANTNVIVAQAADTISSIEAACSSPCLYQSNIAQTFTLGANHALSSNVTVQYGPSGEWTINGTGFTLSNVQVSPASTISKHFNDVDNGGGTGGLSFAQAQPEDWIDWFGAVPTASCTGSDSYPAMQAAINSLYAGKVRSQSLCYVYTSGTPTVSKSNIILQGTAVGNTNATIWAAGNSTVGNVKIAGTSGTHILWSGIDAITFARTVAASTTAGQATGIDLEYVEGYSITNYRVEDSGPYGIYMILPDAAFSGKMAYGAVEWGYRGINPAAGTYYCYYVDASTSTDSWVTHHRGCSTNNKADGTHIFYGDYANGSIFSDIMSDWYQTSLITTSVYLNWNGSGGGFRTTDVNYSNNIFDSNTGACINVNNATSDASSINFRGGACNTIYPSGPAYGVEAHNSIGVNVTDMQFGQVGLTAVAYFDNCSYCSFQRNHLWLNTLNGGALKVNATSGSLFTNNDVRGGNSSSTLFAFTGSSSNVISGNLLNGTASVGMSFDATSNNNLASTFNKLITTSITTPISDLGSGNSLTLTTATNLAGGALGSAPYQSAANTTSFLASPTTSGHTYFYGWQPSGSAIAPVAVDAATYLASPAAIGGSTPAAGSFSSLTDTGITGSTQCLQANSSGVISGTGSACGSGGGGGTNVTMNGGSALPTYNVTGDTSQACSDSSGSGTAGSCSTSVSFTPTTNNCVVFTTTTANTGTGFTENVNSLGAKSLAIPGLTGWTTTLTPGIIAANTPYTMCYNGTNWNVQQTGYSVGAAPSFTGKKTFVVEQSSTTIASITSPAITTVAGEVVVMACRGGTNTITSVAFSDSQGNTWTKLGTGVFSNNPWIQMAFSKITNAGSTTFTCTPNASSGFMAMVVGDFNWTPTTPSSLGTAQATSSTNNSITYTTTTGRAFGVSCTTIGSTSGLWFPQNVLGFSSNLYGISSGTGTDDMACEFGTAPVAVTAASTGLNNSVSAANAATTAGLDY